MAVKLLRNSKNSVITALHSCEERLCAYILLTEREGFFLENLTDVARSIGASYRHMLRMLSRLCSEGILRKERDVYRIIDREELIRRTPDYYLE